MIVATKRDTERGSKVVLFNMAYVSSRMIAQYHSLYAKFKVLVPPCLTWKTAARYSLSLILYLLSVGLTRPTPSDT